MWAWYNKEFNNNPTIGLFDDYIKHKFEMHVNSLPRVIKDESNIEIACISFGYSNGSIIKLLAQRGGYIGAGKFNCLGAMDKIISGVLETDGDKITTPVVAFLTFKT